MSKTKETATCSSNSTRKEMTLQEFVKEVISCLNQNQGKGVLATDCQWFTSQDGVTPHTGYMPNGCISYKISGIEDIYDADTAVVKALREAGVSARLALGQSWFYYLKLEG